MSLGAYYIAHYRLLNAIGVKNLDAKTQSELKAELASARESAKLELEKARAEYAAKAGRRGRCAYCKNSF